MRKKRSIESKYGLIKLGANSRIDDLMKQINFVGLEFSKFDFTDIPMNEWFDSYPEIGNGFCTICTKFTEEEGEFIMEFEEGGFVVPHYHTDYHEKIIVLNGYIIDKVTQIMVKAGGEYIIPKTSKHFIKAPEGATIHVIISKKEF